MSGPFRRQFDRLEASLQEISQEIGSSPKAILSISGHWEADRFTVQAGARPGMVYDYGGFPPEMYRIQYPSPGAPDVAQRVYDLLTVAGIPTALDANRGYDHGTFAPLKAMYPNADVPVLQLSLKYGSDPDEHLAVGRALAPLRDENVVVLGSGLSWHNLRMFGPAARESSQAFDAWLTETLAQPFDERTRRLKNWTQAPLARVSHPSDDHFVPILVAVGAAEREAAHVVYHEEQFMGGVTASSYRFGECGIQ
jgi:aromatic ring-opening dioxygenase catalytic subunit (LigB family)